MSIIGPEHPDHPVQQTLREIRSPRPLENEEERYPEDPLASRKAEPEWDYLLPLSHRDCEALLGALSGPSATSERLARIFYRAQALMSE